VILLVEDNAISRRALAAILVRWGHEVIQVSDGEHAITTLAEGHAITLVITDLAMPKMTGFGVLTHIHQRWPKLPVILTTGYLSPQVAESILNENVKFLSKPIDINELFTTIEGFTAPSV
jgi:CheY-like chemotaxis protein